MTGGPDWQPSQEQVTEEPRERLSRWKRFWKWTDIRNKTGWDWLEILLIPFIIGLATIGFTQCQEMQQRDIEEQRAQADALQAYLDQMSLLLLEKDPAISKEGSVVRTLARARTLTVLGRLDPSRKTEVIRFLVNAELVQRQQDQMVPCPELFQDSTQDPPQNFPQVPIIDLIGADLEGASMVYIYLAYIDLSETYMTNADLFNSDLCNADLSNTDLSDADLRIADLSNADLSGSKLRMADLSCADFSDRKRSCAKLTDNGPSCDRPDDDVYCTKLTDASLSCTELSDGTPACTILTDADLTGADLSKVDLRGANLSNANLRGTDLSGADLSCTELSGGSPSCTDLTGADGFTNEELDQQARSLEGATMPDGKKYAHGSLIFMEVGRNQRPGAGR